jgi:hypothetical protein
MTTQQATVPDTWKGSDVAYVAYEALIRAGKEPGRDFSYQSRTQGRRLESSLEVESLYSHPGGIETRGTDVLARAQLAGQGVTLIMLSHEKLQQDPDWLISEALQYRDHSWE